MKLHQLINILNKAISDRPEAIDYEVVFSTYGDITDDQEFVYHEDNPFNTVSLDDDHNEVILSNEK